MSKTPPLDTDTLLSAIKEGGSVSGTSAETRNPFAKMVAEFEEANDVEDFEVSPSFKSIKEEANPESVSNDDGFDLSAPPRPEVPRANMESLEEQIAIPSRSGIKTTPTSGSFSISPSNPVNDAPPAKRRSMRGLMVGAAALLAIFGTGYLYMQGSHSASSETIVYEAPIFDDEIITDASPNTAAKATFQTSATKEPTPSVAQNLTANEPSNPVAVHKEPTQVVAAIIPTPEALPTKSATRQIPLAFDQKFSDEFPELEGQSLLDLATGVATFGPAETVPNSVWEEVSCAGCHSFNQTNLCEQGVYYFNHDKARIARIQHPYGGGFKTKLMEWAESGCK